MLCIGFSSLGSVMQCAYFMFSGCVVGGWPRIRVWSVCHRCHHPPGQTIEDVHGECRRQEHSTGASTNSPGKTRGSWWLVVEDMMIHMGKTASLNLFNYWHSKSFWPVFMQSTAMHFRGAFSLLVLLLDMKRLKPLKRLKRLKRNICRIGPQAAPAPGHCLAFFGSWCRWWGGGGLRIFRKYPAGLCAFTEPTAVCALFCRVCSNIYESTTVDLTKSIWPS